MSRTRMGDQRVPEDIDAVSDAVLTASRLLVAVSARSLAAAGESLTLPQFRMLVLLVERGPLKLATIAELLGVNPSTVTRMVDRLVASSMVDRQANPVSRRETVVTLTSTGTEVVQQVTERRREEIAGIVTRMSTASRQDLVEALTAFTEAGGEPPVGSSPYDVPKIRRR
ncbi:MarR family winged helix-turn-helix transcriptional regulator [Parasphingorhabdus pacifica]